MIEEIRIGDVYVYFSASQQSRDAHQVLKQFGKL